jgi:hypothetical protein
VTFWPCLRNRRMRFARRLFRRGFSPPYDEVLFFARPKKSTQKKGRPDAAPPSAVPCRALSDSDCGARRGIRGFKNPYDIVTLRRRRAVRSGLSDVFSCGAKRLLSEQSERSLSPVWLAEQRRPRRKWPRRGMRHGWRIVCARARMARVQTPPWLSSAGNPRRGRAIRAAFLLVPFLWPRKEKEPGVGGRNPPSKTIFARSASFKYRDDANTAKMSRSFAT